MALETYVTSFLDNSSFLNGRVGFWGTVCKQHTENHRVDIIMDTGRMILNIPVAMNTWVTNENNTITGERNLPPVGSFVFVLMPTKTVSGAFVLCSGIPCGESWAESFYSKNSSDETTTTKKDFGKWQIDKNRDNGDITLENRDKEILLEVSEKDINVTTKGNLNLKINDVTININNNNVNIDTNKKGSITIEGKTGTLEID